MITIRNTAGKTIYVSDSATDVRTALTEAVKADANLAGANLARANLARAYLARAYLADANLAGAYLAGAYLARAYLAGANLAGANLAGAYLAGAYLAGANLAGANLADANLADANLAGANLADANLADANLTRANLTRAENLSALAAAQTVITPEGVLTGWKKCRGDVVVELKIPAKAKRSNATGRKCRAEYAKVVAIHGGGIAHSQHDPNFTYRVGETVRPTAAFDENRWNECAPGIHFYLTREEAENY